MQNSTKCEKKWIIKKKNTNKHKKAKTCKTLWNHKNPETLLVTFFIVSVCFVERVHTRAEHLSRFCHSSISFFSFFGGWCIEKFVTFPLFDVLDVLTFRRHLDFNFSHWAARWCFLSVGVIIKPCRNPMCNDRNLMFDKKVFITTRKKPPSEHGLFSVPHTVTTYLYLTASLPLCFCLTHAFWQLRVRTRLSATSVGHFRSQFGAARGFAAFPLAKSEVASWTIVHTTRASTCITPDIRRSVTKNSTGVPSQNPCFWDSVVGRGGMRGEEEG